MTAISFTLVLKNALVSVLTFSTPLATGLVNTLITRLDALERSWQVNGNFA